MLVANLRTAQERLNLRDWQGLHPNERTALTEFVKATQNQTKILAGIMQGMSLSDDSLNNASLEDLVRMAQKQLKQQGFKITEREVSVQPAIEMGEDDGARLPG
jgi:hypothetical protein